MSAPRGLAAPGRPRVLWFGRPPSAAVAREFTHRGLTLAPMTGSPGLGVLRTARGAVFDLHDDAADTGDQLRRSGRELINHGLVLCVSAADDAQQGLAAPFLAGLPSEHVERRTAPADHVMSELLARHDPGPAFRADFQPTYATNVEPLGAEDLLLLGRAFHDCGPVVLDEMGGGLSGARVFCVHTTMGNSVGSWAQPLFAKLDRRDRVAREGQNYRAAAPFIPFGLRPNVERMVCGATRGLLVGNLVDKSESPWDVARRGHAEQAIFNLFNTTLGGWRAQGFRGSPLRGPVWPALVNAGIVTLGRVRDDYAAQVALRPLEIAARLTTLDQRYRAGHIHGDLHAENVRVRGSDAILIDLASAQHGPLVADLALLETWLAFALHKSEPTETYEDPAWREMISGLYAPETFISPPIPAEAGSRFGWVWETVRHVRTLAVATQSCSTEYQTAIIAGLLRRGMFPSSCRADKYRRTVAYQVAVGLTQNIVEENVRRVA